MLNFRSVFLRLIPKGFTWTLPRPNTSISHRQLSSPTGTFSSSLSWKLSRNSPRDDFFSKCLRRLLEWMSVEYHMYNIGTKQLLLVCVKQHKTSVNIYFWCVSKLFRSLNKLYWVYWFLNLFSCIWWSLNTPKSLIWATAKTPTYQLGMVGCSSVQQNGAFDVESQISKMTTKQSWVIQ